MVSSQLSLYQGALRICGARPIAILAENRESVRLLNDEWSDGAIAYCLEQGYFTFATRTILLEADPTFTPNFGYQWAFTKPDDYDHTAGVWADPYMTTPLTDYTDEDTVIFADINPIYVSYISLDNRFGMNMGAWSQCFSKLVQAYLAMKISRRLTLNKQKVDDIKKEYEDALTTARNFDVMNKPQRMLPMGTWNQARRGSYRNRQTGGGGF